MAGVVRIILHRIQASVPKGQYLVSKSIDDIGMARTQSEASATARVAIKMLRAVRMPENIVRSSRIVYLVEKVDLLISSIWS